MKKILKIISCLFQIYSAKSWGIDYQNIYGCIKPTTSQSMMGGRTTIKNGDISLSVKNINKDIINNFKDINQELSLEFSSSTMQGILIDISHGTLSLANIIINDLNTKFACDNKRLFTHTRSKTWIYKWLPGEYNNAQITFMYAPAYVPVFLSYFTIPFDCPTCGTTTTASSGNSTTEYVLSTTTNSPTNTITPDEKYKNYNFIKYKSITFGWYLFENKISIISSVKVDGCLKWFSIGFTSNDDMMIGSDSIFGWGDEICALYINVYYLSPRSKDIGKDIYDYEKPKNYLLSKSIKIENNVMTIEFTRLLNTGNSSDVQINLKNNKTNIIYAIGDEMNQYIVSMHTEDESFYVNFLDGFVSDLKEDNEKYYIFAIASSLIIIFGIFSTILTSSKKFYKIMKFLNRLVDLKFLGYFSNGNIIFICLYFTWWISLLIYSFIPTDKSEIIRRLGYWISINLTFTLLPISRNNLSVIIFKISSDKILYTHIYISCLFLISVIIKLIASFVIYKPSVITLLNYSNTNPLAGLLASIFSILISALSIPILRIKFYEIFYYSHRILSFLIILFSSLHSIVTFYYILPSLLLYITDILVRIYKINKIVYANFTNINEDDNKFTMINIISKKDIKTYPSCYFLICYNKISNLEWHALSLVSYDNKNLLFCIKNMGDKTWSGKLYNYILESKDNIDVNKEILIQGPYGSLPINYANYKSLRIIAGGIGITPMFSILDDIYNNKQQTLYKVSVIWIINNASILRYFKKMIHKYNYNELFDIEIYITKHIICDIYSDLKVYFGRPIISNLLISTIDDSYKDNAVICCGPKSLTDDIKSFCAITNIDIFCDSFTK